MLFRARDQRGRAEPLLRPEGTAEVVDRQAEAQGRDSQSRVCGTGSLGELDRNQYITTPSAEPRRSPNPSDAQLAPAVMAKKIPANTAR